MSILPLIIIVAVSCIAVFVLGLFVGFMIGHTSAIEEMTNCWTFINPEEIDHIPVVTNGIQKIRKEN